MSDQPAFPHTETTVKMGTKFNEYHPGLTKREFAAIAAMQGILANERWMERIIENVSGTAWPHIKNLAFDMADAMLKEAPNAE